LEKSKKTVKILETRFKETIKNVRRA